MLIKDLSLGSFFCKKDSNLEVWHGVLSSEKTGSSLEKFKFKIYCLISINIKDGITEVEYIGSKYPQAKFSITVDEDALTVYFDNMVFNGNLKTFTNSPQIMFLYLFRMYLHNKFFNYIVSEFEIKCSSSNPDRDTATMKQILSQYGFSLSISQPESLITVHSFNVSKMPRIVLANELEFLDSQASINKISSLVVEQMNLSEDMSREISKMRNSKMSFESQCYELRLLSSFLFITSIVGLFLALT